VSAGVPSASVPAPDDVETVERVIAAPPEKIFDLLADPSRHQDIDGSGSVRDAKGTRQRLALGTTFGMDMRYGVPYSMHNTVVEFEENRCIAWQTRGPGKLPFGGRIWRYELEPVEGGTRVRESWDISHENTKVVARAGRKKTRKNMEQTLARIERLVAQ